MNCFNPNALTLALFWFQLEAERVAARFGVTAVETCTATAAGLTVYYCRYWLPRYKVPGYWLDSPPPLEADCAETLEEAVQQLEWSLQQVGAAFFSCN